MPIQVTGKGKILTTVSDNCVACRLCQYSCSFVKTGRFGRAGARISIVQGDDKINAAFNDECDSCGYCVSFCKYDALRMERLSPVGR